jgi:hypothetical protein
MKKYLLLVLFFFFVLAWCQTKDITQVDISTINDLSSLELIISQVSQDISSWTLSTDQALDIVNKLQQRYIDLTTTTESTIETKFETIQKKFNELSVTVYWLPLWAKRIWVTEPVGMELNKKLSKFNVVNTSGYSSTVLVYSWSYDVALQQAKDIAKKAHLSVSKNFQQAQSLAKLGNIDYISGLDLGSLSRWIVYTNHELLDTNVDQLLSVSVDQYWILTIEATKYQNN